MSLVSGDKPLGDNAISTLISDIVLAVSIAVEEGLFRQGSIEIAHLAKKTGLLRETIEGDFVNQVAAQSGNTRITINMNKYRLSGVAEYIQHHWNSSPSGGLSYIDPTTPGTIPIFPYQIMLNIKDYIKTALLSQFEGMQYKVTVS